MMRYIYFALRCFLLDFWDHSKGECAASPDMQLLKEIYQAADTNLTSVMGHQAKTDMPGCIHLLAGGRICWINSVRGEEFSVSRPENPSLLQLLQHKAASKDDIFFINFGRWHFNNCAGLQLDTYRRSLRQLAAFYQSTRQDFPNLVYRITAHDHSPCPKRTTTALVKPPTPLNATNSNTTHSANASVPANNSTAPALSARLESAEALEAPLSTAAVAVAAFGGGAASARQQSAKPAASRAEPPLLVSQQATTQRRKSSRFGAECVPAHRGNYSLGIGKMLESEAQSLLGSAGVPLIDNYNVTRDLFKAHIYVEWAGWDCNHWCSPGVPEWEIYTLYKAFKQYNIQPLPAAAASKAQPQCVPVVIQGPPPEGWVVRPDKSSVSVAAQQWLSDFQETY